jgi:hypothetical protein
MFLRRSLPPLVHLFLPANRRFTRPCNNCTKPPNPLSLSPFDIMRIGRIGRRQTHWRYLDYFQRLRPEKGPVFSPKRMVPAYRRLRRRQTATLRRSPELNPRRRQIENAAPACPGRKTCLRRKLEGALRSATCRETSGPAGDCIQSATRPRRPGGGRPGAPLRWNFVIICRQNGSGQFTLTAWSSIGAEHKRRCDGI